MERGYAYTMAHISCALFPLFSLFCFAGAAVTLMTGSSERPDGVLVLGLGELPQLANHVQPLDKKIGAIVVTGDLSPAYADAVMALGRGAPECLGAPAATPPAAQAGVNNIVTRVMEDGTKRVTYATGSEGWAAPDCLDVQAIVETFDRVCSFGCAFAP